VKRVVLKTSEPLAVKRVALKTSEPPAVRSAVGEARGAGLFLAAHGVGRGR
jgi:hypothetical protein